MKAHKKILILLLFLAILAPIGILIPEYFHAGDAWGEWSVETVKEQTGLEPSGMKKTAEIYKAPLPDYKIGEEEQSLWTSSAHYILSGLIGIGIIVVLTVLSVKLTPQKPSK
jgi:hypothetical protein